MGVHYIFLTIGGDKSNVKENISWLSWNYKSKITSISFKDLKCLNLAMICNCRQSLELLMEKSLFHKFIRIKYLSFDSILVPMRVISMTFGREGK